MSKEGKIKKPLFKRWWFWLIVAVVVFGVIGGGGDKDNNVSDQPVGTSQPVSSEEKTKPANEPQETSSKLEGFKPGMYKIGVDMPAGEYKLFCDGFLGYFELTKDSSGSFESIIANDNFENCSYITVKDGQYLKLQDVIAVPIEKAPKSEPNNGMLPSGMYKVGFDIKPGEYKVIADGMGYVEVSKDSSHLFNSIISNDNFEGERYITIKEGQYLKLQRASIKVQ